MLYNTLDEALTDIAGRSFYESAKVTKVGSQFEVIDWYTGVEEITEWTYEDGAKVSDSAVDYSRTHEAYEFYSEASHIRYNLPTAVEAIEGGKSVGFTYVGADAICEDEDWESCGEDHTAGWLLVATDEGE